MRRQVNEEPHKHIHASTHERPTSGSNPWAMTCSTLVENALQIGPVFFKTKPISAKAKMCAIAVLIKDYENKGVFAGRRSKAKQTQFQAPAKMDANLLVEKGL